MKHGREEISMYYQLELIIMIKIISETKNKTISTTQKQQLENIFLFINVSRGNTKRCLT